MVLLKEHGGNMKELINNLIEKAKRAGICSEWLSKIQLAASKDDLLKVYLTGVIWCSKNNLFSSEFVHQNFSPELLQKHGIYIDDNVLSNNAKKMVLLGNCKAAINVTDFGVSEIYITGNSEAEIEVSGHAFCMIRMLENAKVKLQMKDVSSTVVLWYSGKLLEIEKDDTAKYKYIEKSK